MAWALSCTAGLALLFPAHWDLDKLSEGSNVYFFPQQWGKVIDHAESAEGGLTTVTQSADGLLTLLTNGKFQGNNSEQGEMIAQKSIALIPLLHTAQRDTALVIGYGTGMTPRVIHENEFRSLDIAELSEDMVRLADRQPQGVVAAADDDRMPTVQALDEVIFVDQPFAAEVRAFAEDGQEEFVLQLVALQGRVVLVALDDGALEGKAA